MNTKDIFPNTLIECITKFAGPKAALAAMVALRWPDGVECPHCRSKEVSFLENQQRWQCKNKHPHRQFSVKNGTVFEDSPIALGKWLVAIWLLASAKNGISSYEVHRAIGVTQKTAWFMCHRIRHAMHEKSFFRMTGTVEADENFAHTNGLENFWSLMTRMINGTYVAIEPFHLSRYLDEQVYRFNQRKLTDGERFARLVMMVDGLRPPN